MVEKIDLTITDELQRAVKRLDDTRSLFYKSDATFFDVPLRQHARTLVEASRGIFDAVPSRLVLAADEFWHDPQERLYDESDYRALVADGPAICALFVMMEIHWFLKPSSFTSFSSALERLGNDLGDLTSYCPDYDGDHGIWKI